MHSVCLYVSVHAVYICISVFSYLCQVIQLLGSLFLHITYIGLVILSNIVITMMFMTALLEITDLISICMHTKVLTVKATK